MPMTTLPPLSTVPTRRDGVRWITLLLAGAGVAFPFVAWLAGPDRWWSAFIFLPAFVLIGFGLIQVRLGGRLAGWIVRASLGLGAIVMTLALIFAFSMDWHYAWTLMLIMPGLVIAANGYTRAPRASAGFGFGAWVTAIGLSVAALGLVFLGQQLGVYDLTKIFGDDPWWAVFIMSPGVVALACAWRLQSGRGACVGGALLTVIGCLHLAMGVAEWFGLAWQWLPLVILSAVCTGLLLSIGLCLGDRLITRTR
jgi:hypothetical protein